MVKFLVLAIILQNFLCFPNICGDDGVNFNNIGLTLAQSYFRYITAGRKSPLFSYPKQVPSQRDYIKRSSLKGVTAFTCTCMSPEELNESHISPVWLKDVKQHSNDFSWSGTVIYFKILPCPPRVCRKSETRQKIKKNNPKCGHEKNKEGANVKEARINSCTIIANSKSLGRLENNNKRNISENGSHLIPTIQTYRMQFVPIVSSNVSVSFQLSATPIAGKTIIANNLLKETTRQKTQDGLSTQRKRRSSPINLKPMIFPRLNRNLRERKRDNSHDLATKPDKPRESALINNGPANMPFQNANDEAQSRYHRRQDQRRKREMHIMVAKYRKEIKRQRKKKAKTTPRPNCFEDKDRNKGISTTPYTFLNVSFTGYWEPTERTTVRPRVQRPLKMTEQDMNFVYGSSGGYGNNKGNSKSQTGRWSTKVEVNIQSKGK